MTWKEVTARKDYQCHCCAGDIKKGEKHFVETNFNAQLHMYPQINRYCSGCGIHIKDGCSFRQARINAFGSPLLRGWIRPALEPEGQKDDKT